MEERQKGVDMAILLSKELITTGDFSEDPGGWSLSGTWAIAGGVCSCNGGEVGNQFIQQNLSPRAVVGRKHVISYEVTANTLVADTDLRMSSASCWGAFTLSGVEGKHSYIKEVTNESPTFDFRVFMSPDSTGGSISIDDVSVKEYVLIELSRTGHRFSSFPEN